MNLVITLLAIIQFTHLASLTLKNVRSNPTELVKRRETDEFDDIEYLMDQNDDIDSFDDFKKFDTLELLFDEMEKRFSRYQKEYNKHYESKEEEKKRFHIYVENTKKVEQHNAEAKKGAVDFVLSENVFSDLTYDEFVSVHTGSNDVDHDDETSHVSRFKRETHVMTKKILPKTIDWRNFNMVSPPMYQGSCGSCWTFASTGVLEAQISKMTGKLVTLSKQQLVDCAEENPKRCQIGGNFQYAFEHFIKFGMMRNENYPYKAVKTPCKLHRENTIHVNGTKVTLNNEKSLEDAVANFGPVYVSIHASRYFQFYRSGIFRDRRCQQKPNHAVLVVGYGVTNRGDLYWIIRNSYGKLWGENGFIRLAKNVNMCNINARGAYMKLADIEIK